MPSSSLAIKVPIPQHTSSPNASPESVGRWQPLPTTGADKAAAPIAEALRQGDIRFSKVPSNPRKSDLLPGPPWLFEGVSLCYQPT
jgi:hypothetical protein